MFHRIALFLAALTFGATTAAAQDISIGSTVRIGGNVEVTTPTDGPITLVGGRIEVDAPVNGSLTAAGGEISVNGPVQGDIQIAGGQITINGPVAGDVAVAGGKLVLGPGAQVAGKLKFHGGELKRDPAAEVTGGVSYRERRHRHEVEDDLLDGFTRGWWWTAGLAVLAAILAGALPGPSQRLAQELRERPWPTVLVGLIALFAIPVIAVLAMITIIGIPIALVTLAVYAALLLVGYVWLTVVVGGMVLDRFKPETATETAWRVGAAVLTVLVLALLVRVPFLGGLVKLAALMVGLGMIVAVVTRKTG
jgi:cytoskeletal protein CcmA (bactofilin family)